LPAKGTRKSELRQRVSIRFLPSELNEIDQKAMLAGLSRSEFLRRSALRRHINRAGEIGAADILNLSDIGAQIRKQLETGKPVRARLYGLLNRLEEIVLNAVSK